MTVISVSLPDNLLEAMDNYIKSYGYSGRSDLIREAVRELINKEFIDKSREETLAFLLTLTSKSVQENADERVMNVVHKYDYLVIFLQHLKIDEDFCLNIILTRGPSRVIGELAKKVRSIRGVIDVWVKHVM